MYYLSFTPKMMTFLVLLIVIMTWKMVFISDLVGKERNLAIN